ncbi:hypothetical protein GDO86_019912 [Hymenochirus boettgeri]|uniref:Uncharacterized protein n=1 Tax=Hymenochirus boettgeri TaxID=247094 RepID=A0A8T2IIE7_9PIPI|nr:hypothetical protein GDO86_019912 [Hymenochirus boettgeri]
MRKYTIKRNNCANDTNWISISLVMIGSWNQQGSTNISVREGPLVCFLDPSVSFILLPRVGTTVCEIHYKYSNS